MVDGDHEHSPGAQPTTEMPSPLRVLDSRLNFLFPFRVADTSVLREAAARLARQRVPLSDQTRDYFTPHLCQSFANTFKLTAEQVDFEIQPASWDSTAAKPLKKLAKHLQVQPLLTLFVDDGIGILTLRCSFDGNNFPAPALNDLLNLNNYFRYFQWPHQLQYDKRRLHIGGRLLTVQDWIHELLATALGTADAQPYDSRKLFVFCAAIFDRELSDDEYFQYVTVDSEAEDTPQGDVKTRVVEHQSYSRWAHYGTRYGFTYYSGVGAFVNPSYIPPSGTDYFLFTHFNEVYFWILILLLFHRARLVQFSDRITTLSASTPDIHAAAFSALHRDILIFTNLWWFEDITYEVQGAEIYLKWRGIIDNQALYNEVQQKLRETDDYAQARQNQLLAEHGDRLDSRLYQLQGIFIAGVLFAAGALFANLLPDHSDRGTLLKYDIPWAILAVLSVLIFWRAAAVLRELGHFHLGRFFGRDIQRDANKGA